MRLLGIEFRWPFGRGQTTEKSLGGAASYPVSQGSLWGGSAWSWPAVRESFSGAWQKGVLARPEMVLNNWALYACVTLIANDIGKLRIKLVEQDGVTSIWRETTSPSFSPVLTKPNGYQNRIKFLEQWVLSKLTHGNTYVLKVRDNRGVVTELHVLDPNRCKPLVAPDGAVYYQLGSDWLAGVPDGMAAVPASEIIHDRMNALFHPLVGISPIFACGLAAAQGLAIQRNSAAFFGNGARPSGILTAPGSITKEQADELKARWQENYTGENAGRVAILGNGLTYVSATMTAVDAQLIDQLKMSAEMVCACHHVPLFMIGLAELPARIAIEALNQQYYSQALQTMIESIELCLDEGLGLVNVPGHTYGTELDLAGLLRMDTAAQYKALGDAIQAGLLTPNEGRKDIDRDPLKGGDTVYLQQQNFSLEALAKRDAKDDPFGSPDPAPAAAPADPPAPAADKSVAVEVRRNWERVLADAGH